MTAEQTVVVQRGDGLHARPAALFVERAGRFASEIELLVGDKRVNARSVIGLLKLGVRQGARLTIRATGEDAQAAVEELAGWLTRDDDGEGQG